jgi:hypothetical protein
MHNGGGVDLQTPDALRRVDALSRDPGQPAARW